MNSANATTAHATAFVTSLNAAQAKWLAANGIEFYLGRGYNCYTHRATGLAVEVYAHHMGNAFDVTRRPTTELDGPDCNDGEPVRMSTHPTIREALRALATR